ncbi:microtubule-associated protein 9 [Spea bombifrons]|uniref:microtubule-associated protein 9 n=1 Tax=Spea bombifrons TaxID=233779 RepID=UPI00234B0A3A|nr:microtubule-associated protein 9 [Spea bombifrons]
MDSDDEFSTTLAYTKSPKTAKRTTFQDELKKAISARVSRQQAIEEPENSDYSEEFDSDDSLNESSDEENFLKSKLKKTFHDFNISDEENEAPQKLSFLKKKHQLNEHVNENSEKKTDIYGRGVPPSLDEKKKDARIIDDKESKPVPKPREARLKSPILTQGVSISTLDENFKPTPQQRNFLKKNRYTEDNDYALTEEVHSSTKYTSVSTNSSVTRLSDKVSASEGDVFPERFSPEGPEMSRQPSMDSKFKSETSRGEKNLAISRERSLTLQDLQIQAKEDSQNNGRKSPSVLELMLGSIEEKSKEENKEPLLQDTGKNDLKKKSEGRHPKEDDSELARSHSSRSLPCQDTSKKSAKQSTKMSAKSRYLGTLTVLDKSIKESSGEVEAADVLRATVYQNWLEKKKAYLKELHTCKKTDEDQEKEKNGKETIKKEEARAAFLAWKSEKKKEIHILLTKHKEAEEKKMKEIREIAQKKEDAKRAFEKWKEAKDLYLKEKALKEKDIETEKKRKEQKSVLEKKKENVSAVKSWSEQKDHMLKKKKKEKISERLKEDKLKAMKEEQEKKAMELYEEWLEKKERRERIERNHKKLQGILRDEPPPPWSPPGKTIPTGR